MSALDSSELCSASICFKMRIGRLQAGEFVDQFCHVFWTPDEGEGEPISVSGGKLEILTVLGRQRRNTQFGIRQVNAFSGMEFGRAIGGMRNFYFEPAFAVAIVNTADDPTDLAVVEKYALAGPCIREDCP